MNLGPRGGKSVGNRGEHENSVSASQPGAWHPQPDLGGVASPPGGGAWPWGGARPRPWASHPHFVTQQQTAPARRR